MISNKTAVQSLIQLLKAHEVKDVIISPGSRNAPLTLSFEADPFFQCISIVDERSAAFFALGMAQQSGHPVVISCTSGSASLNYSPAIAEAYYQKIPLIVVTSDRPKEWIDRGEGQSIRQTHVYHNYIKAEYELVQEADDKDSIWHNEVLINQAIETCKIPLGGPVHLNIPFREPLYQQVASTTRQGKVIRSIKTDAKLKPEDKEVFAQKLASSQKILVLVGLMPPNPLLSEALHQFAQNPKVLVLTETTSNLFGERYIDTIDRLITTFDAEEASSFSADILMTFGGQIVSKKIKRLIREYPPQEHWHISLDEPYFDTFQCLSLNIPLSPLSFFQEMKAVPTIGDSLYHSKWFSRYEEGKEKHKAYLEKARFSDLKAVEMVLQCLPSYSNLQMGNSTVVRYVQLFGNREDLSYNANRGTSGIDGCTSTAAGAAYASQMPTTLISGDLSFFYDSNALWNSHIPPNLKIVILNNDGGGIFRIIDGPSDTSGFETFFETSHGLTAEYLAKMHKVTYLRAGSETELIAQLASLYASDEPCILEVFTPRTENDKVLKDYFHFIADRKLNF